MNNIWYEIAIMCTVSLAAGFWGFITGTAMATAKAQHEANQRVADTVDQLIVAVKTLDEVTS